ncbi:hypothetical protein E6O75_ATG02005 [Venturia nashicola]|uniref:Uncharacterized protein n=1 Tax=Venturia nashicola TaxID=86259 RepID=A0A4Z1PCU2_9PEZI|nr:hypothetical protein E6O75_ATG02005 [Venturia nashicola]
MFAVVFKHVCSYNLQAPVDVITNIPRLPTESGRSGLRPGTTPMIPVTADWYSNQLTIYLIHEQRGLIKYKSQLIDDPFDQVENQLTT